MKKNILLILLIGSTAVTVEINAMFRGLKTLFTHRQHPRAEIQNLSTHLKQLKSKISEVEKKTLSTYAKATGMTEENFLAEINKYKENPNYSNINRDKQVILSTEELKKLFGQYKTIQDFNNITHAPLTTQEMVSYLPNDIMKSLRDGDIGINTLLRDNVNYIAEDCKPIEKCFFAGSYGPIQFNNKSILRDTTRSLEIANWMLDVTKE